MKFNIETQEIDEFAKHLKTLFAEESDVCENDIYIILYNYTRVHCEVVFGIYGDSRYVECAYRKEDGDIYVEMYTKYE